MKNEFEEVMSQNSDAELLEVLNSNPGDYQPLALEAAKIEFKKRNLSGEQLLAAEGVNKQKQEIKTYLSNEPLSTSGKIFAFIFPRIFSLLLWKTYEADGQERKYKERLRWQLYGTCFYIALFLIYFIVYYFINKNSN